MAHRHPLNAPGPFYVENERCILCLLPHHEAPTLMGIMRNSKDSDKHSHCYFKRQPESDEEIEQAIRALRIACCSALRYAGNDQKIIEKLKELGLGLLADDF